MKRTLTLGIGLSVILFFTSCQREESVNIDQSRIYTAYSYTYDAEQSQSIMNASFRIDNSGGNRIELSFPARVSFDDENMSFRKAFGDYQLKRSGNLINGMFSYTDVDGKVLENSISALRPIALPFGLNSISRNGNFFLPWEGDALQAGETITVTINPDGEGSTRSFTTSSAGATHIILDENKLSQLEPGFAKVRITRERESGLQQSTLSGGRLELKYKSREVSVEIN